MITYELLYAAKADFRIRRCGKDYRIVKLKPVEVEEIIPLSKWEKWGT